MSTKKIVSLLENNRLDEERGVISQLDVEINNMPGPAQEKELIMRPLSSGDPTESLKQAYKVARGQQNCRINTYNKGSFLSVVFNSDRERSQYIDRVNKELNNRGW